MPTFKSLYEENRDSLKLEWLAGRASIDRPLDTPANAGLSSADLVGHLNLIHPNRLHVLGHPEVHYYLKLEPARRLYYARELIAGGPIGLVIGEGLAAPEELLAAAEAAALPTLSSPLPAAEIIEVLRIYLAKLLATHCTLHGVYMDVLGMGVLIAGESGVGKSELGTRADQPRARPRGGRRRRLLAGRARTRSKGDARRCCRTFSRSAASVSWTSSRSSGKRRCGGR